MLKGGAREIMKVPAAQKVLNLASEKRRSGRLNNKRTELKLNSKSKLSQRHILKKKLENSKKICTKNLKKMEICFPIYFTLIIEFA